MSTAINPSELGFCIDAINALEQYALTNYEAGGHWVYECFDVADYMEYLEEAHGDAVKAKAKLKDYWELTNAMQRECAWGAPDEPADIGCEFDPKLK